MLASVGESKPLQKGILLLNRGLQRRKVTRNIHIVRSINEMQEYRRRLFRADKSVGFVPTMGALHDGHISLVRQAANVNDEVIVSIFVNPTQFSKGEDLDKYPRQFEADIALLKSSNVHCVFAPNTTEMYPSGALCHIEPTAFSTILEGKARPDFFRGVATVVCKLFNIVSPTTAYFGQKDISQCILIRKMVTDLNMPVHVSVCETIRELDGLAMSSRNVYLSPGERSVASIVYRSLDEAKQFCESKLLAADEVVERDVIVRMVTEALRSEPQVTQVEYVSFASHKDMQELAKYKRGHKDSGAVISTAVKVGNVRLIDNLLIGKAQSDILGIRCTQKC